MHELSIADAILEVVRKEAEQRPGAHVAKVGVRVGVLSGIEPDALSFGFECLVQGTTLAPLQLVIEGAPRRQRCAACDLTFDAPDDSHDGRFGAQITDAGLPLACPRCANPETQLAGGTELDIVYLEVEE